MNKEISVVLSADNRYARYCAVTILSVLKNTSSPEKFHFYVLSPDITQTNIKRINQLCDNFQSKVSIIPIDLKLFEQLPNLQHLSLNTYSRLCSPRLCKDSKYLIYLDCDLVVLGDIAELSEVSLKNKPVGAVAHVQFPYQETFKKVFAVNGEDDCFNGGVMLIDAEAWRTDELDEKIIQCAIANSDKLHFGDQDALNKVFWKNYFHLPGVWNVEARLYKEKLLGLPQTQEITQRILFPKIIHYTGADKPWSSKNYVPKREIYLEYSDRLKSLISWFPDVEVRNCSPLSYISFIYSCIYFRLSFYIKNVLLKRYLKYQY